MKPPPAPTFTVRPSRRSRRCWSKPRARCKILPAKLFTKRGKNQRHARAAAKPKRSEEVTDLNLADTRIGSGSDHTVFLNFVGMPVLGLGFEGPYGVYHSAYDDFFWMNHFGDPGYRYHTLMSQLWGVLALRLANADLLPFDFASYASNIRQFVNELAKNNKTMWGPAPTASTELADWI